MIVLPYLKRVRNLASKEHVLECKANINYVLLNVFKEILSRHDILHAVTQS
jgi:hypothetical protein